MKNVIQRFRTFIGSRASGRNVLVWFVSTQVVYATMILFTIPKLMQHSNGMDILDMLPLGYGEEYVQELFASLGQRGRDVYLYWQIPLDMVYPGSFAIAYSLLLTFILGKSHSRFSRIQNLAILPIFVGLFDYVENLGIVGMLCTYPEVDGWLVGVTSVFSVLKAASTTLVFVLMIFGAFVLLLKHLRGNRHKSGRPLSPS